jgi:hypothetical protein
VVTAPDGVGVLDARKGMLLRAVAAGAVLVAVRLMTIAASMTLAPGQDDGIGRGSRVRGKRERAEARMRFWRADRPKDTAT